MSDSFEKLGEAYNSTQFTTQFNSKAEDYALSRPGYPPTLYNALWTITGVDAGDQIIDVGAGTGLFTQGLLGAGRLVLAVEPADEMRSKADALFGNTPGYASASGTAESLPVENQVAKLITAAQAYHWFNVPLARAEFMRVLKPGGWVALVWNDRQRGQNANDVLDGFGKKYGGQQLSALAAHENAHTFGEFFGNESYQEHFFKHDQQVDMVKWLALLFSRSYMPARESSAGHNLTEEASKAFQELQQDGQVTVPYTTRLVLGQFS